MKIVPFDDSNWMNDHPLGVVLFKHLLSGEPDSPDNFMYIVGRQDGDFSMPVHRHNFDQIRLPLRGDMNLGRAGVLRENEIGYFPEGLAYGPQEDPLGNALPGERRQLVLQFGGASGYGFMSIEQRRKARDELAEIGQFEGAFYRKPNGKKDWALSAIWEHVFGSKLRYPHPRYKKVIVVDPQSCNWLPFAAQRGVDRKFMGAFSERGVWMEMIRLQPGAAWHSSDPRGRRLLVVLEGDGMAHGQAISYLSALQVESDEALSVSATREMTLFLVGLPPVEVPVVDSGLFDSPEEVVVEDASD